MYKIALSAGHHPMAKGASFGELNEYDQAWLWVDLIAEHMPPAATVIKVPTGFLPDKISFINKTHGLDLAIEIHFNGDYGQNVSGCETLYHPQSTKGKIAAGIVNDAIVASLGNRNRGIKEGYYQMNPNKPIDAFLRKTYCPALILEPEFIRHVPQDSHVRTRVCKAIASSIVETMELI